MQLRVVIIFLLFFPMLSLAQRRPSGNLNTPQTSRGTNSSSPSSGNYIEQNPDTASISYFYADHPNLRFKLVDSLLDNNLHQYDLARFRDLDYAHLGAVGTAAYPLIFETNFHQGVEVGLKQFDLYRAESRLRYYKLYKAFTDVRYSQGGNQEDGYLKLQFARNFAKGLHLTIHHEKINQTVDETTLQQVASYIPQNTQNSIFGIGVWYHSPKGNYDGFFSYQIDYAEQSDNGGITDEASQQLLTGNNDIAFTLNTFLTDANTRYEYESLNYNQYYRLNTKTDSSKTVARDFIFSHGISFKNNKYKFADEPNTNNEPTASDSVFYQNFQVDDRGLRHYIGIKTLENSFSINTNRKSGVEDLLELGLKHSVHFVNQEPIDTSYHNFFLSAKLNFSLKDKLILKTYAHYGLLANRGDHRLSAALSFDFQKAGRLDLEGINQRYSPSLIQRRFFISQQEFWKNDFKKTFETSLSGTYTLPRFPISLTGKYHLLDNLIYYDTASLAQQLNTPASILQLIAKVDFNFWKFSLKNLIVFQRTPAEISLPEIFSKHSLSYQNHLFKNALILKIGIDARFNSSYFPYAYQPITGQFHLQQKRKTPLYPATDVFVSLKVTRFAFRFFVKLENINSLITNEYYFQTYRYPVPDLSLRLGFFWKFLD